MPAKKRNATEQPTMSMFSKTGSSSALSSIDPVYVTNRRTWGRSDDARATYQVPSDWTGQTLPAATSRLCSRPSAEGQSVRRAMPPSHTIKIPPVGSGLWWWRSGKPYFAHLDRATEGRECASAILVTCHVTTAQKGLKVLPNANA